jgi:hypothetical protein
MAALLMVGLVLSSWAAVARAEPPPFVEVIVQERGKGMAAAAVRARGGQVTHQLGIINSVGARVPETALQGLMGAPGVRAVYANRPVQVAGIPPSQTTTVYVDQDSWLDQAKTNKPSGNEPILNVMEDSAESQRAVYRFDLSAVPAAYVLSAQAHFHVLQAAKGTVQIHRVTDDWTENGVTWDDAASDFDPVADGSFRPGKANQYVSADITDLVREWVSGQAPNQGVMLIAGTVDQQSSYFSKEAALTSEKPYLEIEYIPIPYTNYPALTDADDLHAQGVDGSGVTVAVVDTGYWSHPALDKFSDGQVRVVAQYDAIANQVQDPTARTDYNGHGAHVSSLLLSSWTTPIGQFNGVAPAANLVTVKAFDANGAGSYMDVIRAIDWVVANKDTHNIRVLNLSFSAQPQSLYWDDPLNQAVMRAWQAGVVVVAAAGNRGPDPMTVGVPGNVPYVITAGAMSDNYTPNDLTDDFLADFSSAGPTVEGFVKPDLVAPGAHMLGLMPADGQFAMDHPELYVGRRSEPDAR